MVIYYYHTKTGGYKLKQKLFFFSIVLNLIGILAAGFLSLKLGYFQEDKKAIEYDMNPFYVERVSHFNAVDIPKNSIVFIGDSLTQRGLWNEFFPNKKIVNRGINSDTTEGVINRINPIIQSKPSQVFIMIGVNDLFYKKNIKQIESNYQELLSEFKQKSPETKVYIQSLLPVNDQLFGESVRNKDINNLNKSLKELSSEYGYEYIDVNSRLKVGGQLPKDITLGGVHLTGEGYLIWKEALEKYLK